MLKNEDTKQKNLIDRASWLKTIGFFGVVNAVLILLGIPVRFIFTLAVTDFCATLATFGGDGFFTSIVALIAAGIACAGAYFLAYFGENGYAWAFKAGAAIYTIDLLLWVLVGNWIEVVAHGFVMYQLLCGIHACKKS